ncbi:MAG: peptidase M48 [Gammaproteobacteria bacterium]|nr:MAG: peptidase M48 [Gammaproteobacteria bacterium]
MDPLEPGRLALLGLDPEAVRRHRLLNALQSLALLAALAALAGAVGWLLAGGAGLWLALAAVALLLAFNPALSPALVLRLYRAEPLEPWEAPALHRILAELARRAELPAVPRLWYVPSSMINAFAVGTEERAAVAVTDGLLRALDLRQIAAVLAHEVSHIRHRDTWIMGLADLISRVTVSLSYLGQLLLFLNLPLILLTGAHLSWWAVLLLVFAPTLTALIQLALSRTREYDADLGAALLTGDPEALASALARMERLQAGRFESLFLPGRRLPEPSLLRTHPPTEERIRRLLALRERRLPPRLELEGWEGWHRAPPGGPPRWRASGLWW